MTKSEEEITNLIAALPEGSDLGFTITSVLGVHNKAIKEAVKNAMPSEEIKAQRQLFSLSLGLMLGITILIGTITFFVQRHKQYWDTILVNETKACAEGKYNVCIAAYFREKAVVGYETNRSLSYKALYKELTGKDLLKEIPKAE